MGSCLLSRCYSAALPVLQEPALEVDPARTALTPTDFYLYCYYGGMLHTGRRDYRQAAALYLACVTAPALLGNAITLACYKKWVLASLLDLGACPPLPKFCSPKVRTMVEADARAYAELAVAAASRRADKVARCVEAHNGAYAADGNLGLVKLVVAAASKRAIQRLTQTYLTLSLAEVAAQVGLPSAQAAEAQVLAMIEAGEVHAQVSGVDAVWGVWAVVGDAMRWGGWPGWPGWPALPWRVSGGCLLLLGGALKCTALRWPAGASPRRCLRCICCAPACALLPPYGPTQISQAEGGMVRFLEEPQRYDDDATAAHLAGVMQRYQQLAARLAGVDQAISTDRMYLLKVAGKERSSRYDTLAGAMGPGGSGLMAPGSAAEELAAAQMMY